MDMSKYTQKLQESMQTAQKIALRKSHQRITPEHILAALLEDTQDTAGNLLQRTGADVGQVQSQAIGELEKIPSVEGSGANQIYLEPTTAKVFDSAEQIAKKSGDEFVTIERMLQALVDSKPSQASQILNRAGVTPDKLKLAIDEMRKGRTADSATVITYLSILNKHGRMRFYLLVHNLPLVVYQILYCQCRRNKFTTGSVMIKLPSGQRQNSHTQLVKLIVHRTRMLSQCKSEIRIHVIIREFSFLIRSFYQQTNRTVT